MRKTIEEGISFGLTSGVITTLGLMVGLDAATSSRLAVAGGIISIAVADSMSDALGVHTLEETNKERSKHVWESTFATFIAKFLFALTFLVPVLLFNLKTAIGISIVWGLLLLIVLSRRVAKATKEDPVKTVFTHVSLGIVVLMITYYVGKLVAVYFQS